MITFVCNRCDRVFNGTRTEEETIAEMRGFFGKSIRVEECVVICDDCFKQIHPENHPHEVERAVAHKLKERNQG